MSETEVVDDTNLVGGGSLFAKVIVLGDRGTGRSELIRNLDLLSPLPSTILNAAGQSSARPTESQFFTSVDLAPHELDCSVMSSPSQGNNGTGSAGNARNQESTLSSSPVTLKLWEHSADMSKKDEEIAFRGALICIITFDLRSKTSFTSVFDKWVPLKEALAPDAFLYVVATGADAAVHRQVALAEATKAVARRDGMYVEVSSVLGTNLPLFRSLLARRVGFVLQQRDQLLQRLLLNGGSSHMESVGTPSPVHTASANQPVSTDDSLPASDGSVASSRQTNFTHLPNGQRPLQSVSCLEPNIVSNNIGSILSSFYGLEVWEGYHLQEKVLNGIAEQMDSFVGELSRPIDLPSVDLKHLALHDHESPFAAAASSSPLHSIESDATRFLAKLQEASAAAAAASDSLGSGSVCEEGELSNLLEAFKILELQPPSSIMNMVQEATAKPTPKTPTPVPTAHPPVLTRSVSGNSITPPPAPISPSGSRSSKFDGTNQQLNSPTKAVLQRLVVKLPTGVTAELVFNLELFIEDQVHDFMNQYGVPPDHEARRKMIAAVSKIQRDYYANAANATVSPVAVASQQRHPTQQAPPHPSTTQRAQRQSIASPQTNRPRQSHFQ